MHSNEIHFQCSASFEMFMRNPIIFKQLYARHFTNAVSPKSQQSYKVIIIPFLNPKTANTLN